MSSLDLVGNIQLWGNTAVVRLVECHVAVAGRFAANLELQGVGITIGSRPRNAITRKRVAVQLDPEAGPRRQCQGPVHDLWLVTDQRPTDRRLRKFGREKLDVRADRAGLSAAAAAELQTSGDGEG